MKLLLLKSLWQRRAKDEGFTLPIVIAFGLVMVLLGTVNIVKSSEENLNATIQNSSSDALAIAEVGISKYRELLNQNRILTVYNHDVWDSNAVAVNGVNIDVAGQTCTDMTTAPLGWTGTATQPNDTAATATDAATDDDDNWWNISEDIDGDGTTETIGEYRLVSYEYDIDGLSISEDEDGDGNLDDTTPNDENGIFNNIADVNPDFPTDTSNDNDTDDDGVSDARGILTVQGRSPDGGIAQIQVDIPLRINTDEMNNLAPAIWIGSTDPGYISNLNANLGALVIPNDSNIVLTDGNSGCGDPPDIAGNSVVSDARGVPLLTQIASKITEAQTAGSINSNLPPVGVDLGNTGANPYVTPADGTFNAATDCRNISNCRYYYDLNGTEIKTVTETDGVAKVTLYVDGNLNINQDILGSGVSSDYLEIYVTGAGSININSDQVDTVKALIHAPQSTLTIGGTGSVNIIGSVWVDKFINSATVNFGVETSPGTFITETTRINSRTRVPTYEIYTTAGTRVPRPLTSSPTNWVREEAE